MGRDGALRRPRRVSAAQCRVRFADPTRFVPPAFRAGTSQRDVPTFPFAFIRVHSRFKFFAMSKAILLVNLGSPDSPSVPDVRRYLREFLMDGRVLDVNWLVRFCIVHFAILPSRPKQSAHAYQSVWTPEGSPLIVISKNVHARLQPRVNVPVEL